MVLQTPHERNRRRASWTPVSAGTDSSLTGCAAAQAVSAAVSAPVAPWRPGADAQAEQFALDPLVAPARILSRHLLHQGRDPRVYGRPAAAVRVGPALPASPHR